MDAPPVIIPRRSAFPWWLVVALPIVAALVIALYRFDPARNSFYPRCFLYTTTGLYCPGCGSLRALHQLAHGHLLTALHYNPLLVLSLPLLVLAGLRHYFLRRAGESPAPFIVRPLWIKLVAAAIILFTILRNIPYPPFTSLAPPAGGF
jgi:hypothetical protein